MSQQRGSALYWSITPSRFRKNRNRSVGCLMVHDTTFSFYIWKWSRCEATNNSEWKMLPQTFHKRALLMCAIYLFNTFMVHKAIHSQLLSFVGVRLVLGGRQNSRRGPSSKGKKTRRQTRTWLKSSVPIITSTASPRVLNTASFPSTEWLILPRSPQPPEMQSCDCYRNLEKCWCPTWLVPAGSPM